jgi:hypothetical protein
MRYTVSWMPRTEGQLATIWMNAVDRNAVTVAIHELEERLAEDPENEGESRAGDERITFELPLSVLFQVFPDDLKVEVYTIGYAPPRN